MKFSNKNLPLFLILLSVSLVVLLASNVNKGEIPALFGKSPDNNIHEVYVMKNYWHTGIILKSDSLTLSLIPPLRNIPSAVYFDIGWGDEDFYQNPDDFDLFLALKAIGIPSGSVLRITGHVSDINKLIGWSDFTLKFKLTDQQYLRLCNYIYDTFELDENNRELITSRLAGGQIIFFKAKPDYHLLNTCNTWVANAFRHAGYKLQQSDIITARKLFNALKDFGEILKEE